MPQKLMTIADVKCRYFIFKHAPALEGVMILMEDNGYGHSQPEDGYKTEKEAEEYLISLLETGKEVGMYVILKTWYNYKR